MHSKESDGNEPIKSSIYLIGRTSFSFSAHTHSSGTWKWAPTESPIIMKPCGWDCEHRTSSYGTPSISTPYAAKRPITNNLLFIINQSTANLANKISQLTEIPLQFESNSRSALTGLQKTCHAIGLHNSVAKCQQNSGNDNCILNSTRAIQTHKHTFVLDECQNCSRCNHAHAKKNLVQPTKITKISLAQSHTLTINIKLKQT